MQQVTQERARIPSSANEELIDVRAQTEKATIVILMKTIHSNREDFNPRMTRHRSPYELGMDSDDQAP